MQYHIHFLLIAIITIIFYCCYCFVCALIIIMIVKWHDIITNAVIFFASKLSLFTLNSIAIIAIRIRIQVIIATNYCYQFVSGNANVKIIYFGKWEFWQNGNIAKFSFVVILMAVIIPLTSIILLAVLINNKLDISNAIDNTCQIVHQWVDSMHQFLHDTNNNRKHKEDDTKSQKVET